MDSTVKQAQGQVETAVETEREEGVLEAKGAEPSRITKVLPSEEEDEEPPGVVDDSDSEEDRPSRWDSPLSQPKVEVGCSDVPDLLDSFEELDQKAYGKWNTQPAWSPDGPRVGPRPHLDLPPGVSPLEAFKWATGDMRGEGGDSGTGGVAPDQSPVSREEPGVAEGIKCRSQAALSGELETSSAAVPLVPMDPGAGPHEALL